MSAVRELDALDRVQIAAPCTADWDAMAPVDAAGRARHCASCDKHVYDVSAFPRAEALAFLASHAGQEPPCLRLYRRADGTLLTADCTVGLATRVKRRVLRGWTKLAALFGLTVGSLSSSGCLMGVADRGDMCRLPPPPPNAPKQLAPQELATSLHELVPEHQLLEPVKRAPRPLPRAGE